MRVRILGVVTVMVAVVAAAVMVAPPIRGQSAGAAGQRPRVLAFDWADGDVQIGASVRDVDSADITREKLAADAGGAVVEDVESDGPAARAGLKTGDVVVEYDGERIRSARHLIRLVRESRDDRPVKVVVVRAGTRTDVTITPRGGRSRSFALDDRALRGSLRGLRSLGPGFGDLGRDLGRDLGNLGRDIGRDFGGTFSFEFDSRLGLRGRLGVTIQTVTGQLAEYFGVKAGVLVTSVTADTPASKAGIKAGDVITAINGRSVSGAADLSRELRDVDAGKDVSIEVSRDRKTMTLKATLEDRPIRRMRMTTRRGI